MSNERFIFKPGDDVHYPRVMREGETFNTVACCNTLRSEEGDKYARRIAACLNACQGIPTEDLERWDRAAMVKRLGDMCDIEDDNGPVAFALTTLALLVGLRKSDIGIPEGAWELAEELLKFLYLKTEGTDN